jgi:hypothetical protein
LHHFRCRFAEFNEKAGVLGEKNWENSENPLPLHQLWCNNPWTLNCTCILHHDIKTLKSSGKTRTMWLEKISSGVLRVLTPLGPRNLKPSFQRLYLLWVFRNFQTLPIKVLTMHQQRLLEAMCAENRFVSFGVGVDDAPLLGTLEQRPPVPSAGLPPRRPSSSVADSVAPFAADGRRQ